MYVCVFQYELVGNGMRPPQLLRRSTRARAQQRRCSPKRVTRGRKQRKAKANLANLFSSDSDVSFLPNKSNDLDLDRVVDDHCSLAANDDSLLCDKRNQTESLQSPTLNAVRSRTRTDANVTSETSCVSPALEDTQKLPLANCRKTGRRLFTNDVHVTNSGHQTEFCKALSDVSSTINSNKTTSGDVVTHEHSPPVAAAAGAYGSAFVAMTSSRRRCSLRLLRLLEWRDSPVRARRFDRANVLVYDTPEEDCGLTQRQRRMKYQVDCRRVFANRIR